MASSTILFSDSPENNLLRPPGYDHSARNYIRDSVSYSPLPALRDSLILKERNYRQQYANIYFLRLANLKPIIEERAKNEWGGIEVDGHKASFVERVLDVKQGELCWIIGTVYMDMPLKPNILEDISKDHWVAAPVPRAKYTSKQDLVMLEDESGRVTFSGLRISQEKLVTGCVIGVLGTETPDGEFDVVDICYPEMPPQKKRDVMDDSTSRYVVLASGLHMSGEIHESMNTCLLLEYLTGELCGANDADLSSRIVRLILAGNSLADQRPVHDENSVKQRKKYGYDASLYNSRPTESLDSFLSDLCPHLNVDMMPGPSDPANVTLPQQPVHTAMFPTAKAFLGSSFQSVTNPYWCEIEDVIFLGTSGQTIDDVYKYVEGEDKLTMMEMSLRWRHYAPTAPDTLWCYPFQDQDPFLLENTPHVYFLGNQEKFETRLVEGHDGQRTRLIAVPKFSETGTVVLLNLSTLGCEPLTFSLPKRTFP
ncbi:DNA polymerase subunit delta-2 [Neolecta irregularis DAH-3]|uniref:DNA-directed DNA polymerase n=1 Tax=Neolecta irregularis (strain DAH-3) TaxID=1198029 RepID=A0A1U7LQJ1_NEOID|nr:DNA polymerase subunit delta-2 [Neolecta irregularis DAH-3]|eukprot:OLL24899.1 DNA polymerase subunit delta-2 [Neolecta irregularis DAH-3]